MSHDQRQLLIFLTYINSALDDPHISMYIRSLLRGQDVQTKEYLKRVPNSEMLRKRGYELLFTYCLVTGISNEYLSNSLERVTLKPDKEQWSELKAQLTETLELLNLPNDNSESQ